MFQRHPLREPVQKEILARLADGRLPAGTRINESHLSKALGISRTPLREAMLGLESAGFLASDMGRGFLVPLLDAQEFLDLQEVLARLEPVALTAAMPLTPQRVMELNNLLVRSKLRATQPGSEQAPALAELVYRWAALLTEPCPNRTLRMDILRMEGLARRYWRAAVPGGLVPLRLVGSLEELYELVRAGQAARAASHWSEHILQMGQEAVRHLPATV